MQNVLAVAAKDTANPPAQTAKKWLGANYQMVGTIYSSKDESQLCNHQLFKST